MKPCKNLGLGKYVILVLMIPTDTHIAKLIFLLSEFSYLKLSLWSFSIGITYSLCVYVCLS